MSYLDFIITAGRDGGIKLWSPSIAQVLGELAGHSHEVVGMEVHPTKPQLLSASQDGSVKVWGLDTLTELCQILIPEESLSRFALVDPHHAICYSQKGVTMLNICTVSKSCLLSTHTHSVLSYVACVCTYVSQTSNFNDTYVCLYVYLHIVCHNSIALPYMYLLHCSQIPTLLP